MDCTLGRELIERRTERDELQRDGKNRILHPRHWSRRLADCVDAAFRTLVDMVVEGEA